MKRFGLSAGLVVVLAVNLPAQVVSQHHATPNTKLPASNLTEDQPAITVQATAKVPDAAAAPDKPKVTDLQQTQLELYTTQLNMISIQMNQMAAPIQQKRQALIEALVKANPGYRWQEPGGLVKIPAPVAPAPTQVPAPATTTGKGVEGQPTQPTGAAKP